jgi:nitrogen fixation/metabolism regulation signal transduction histidine kinase
MALNILMNSVEAFKEQKLRDRKIEIRISESTITFCDNAGGFEQPVLKNISQGKFVSTRAGGSGLGLLFVFDGMKKIGGKGRALNADGGACVELQFPNGVIRPTHGKGQ